MAIEFKLPELGENIVSGRVAAVLIKEGDSVTADQPLAELETDKAVIEVPSPVNGTVKKVLIKEGQDVKIGEPMFIFEEESDEGQPTAQKADETTEKESPETSVAPDSVEMPAAADEAPIAAQPAPVIEEDVPAAPQVERKTGELAPAAPSVRRFAREIGIDINQVPGTGPGGRISIEDVKAYSKMLNKQRALQAGAATGVQAEPLPDFEKWGEIERQPMNRVREITARHLSYAWSTIPHVTQFDKADITDLEALRKKYSEQVQQAGGKLTVTAILLKVVALALKKFPQFNASIDLAKNEIIFKKYINIGVAVDTDRGLLVPVVKNVEAKSITELAVELAKISQKARERKLTPDEMQGGNFSISNLGGIGGTGFTPVVNAPEVAILGVSRSEIQPVYKDGQFVPRLMLPLSLSYDHRLIDGADAARFLRWICEALEQPFLLTL
ncbi:catalytic domain-containing protein of component of various dehydrogenase complexes [Caldithrix abyssi DSM 13497]|uniref:Dihydrolipoamide acetyltransferase component of pyruvate dehydrogenase complex n=1 Tax=Caldithrix abyssi DSM 13497 TaxID=880073 RepID=H1XYS4_CALAY|nr:2-oxo acid dehydrogenase subunit E2 [Caldithrix abyssi]APF20545.1 pyruvate dehydrogenase E2 component (dihydrolipoamide acetyltransferase) [Caldithrix abyssi DSM 13497]EHO40943.1 catalytic domain-containing protein of component of various dehydrogenase complexes [Caldithrix abyssi DSM 13497]